MKLVRVRENDIDHYSLNEDDVTYYIDGQLRIDPSGENLEVVKENATNADLKRLQHDIETLDLKWDRVEEKSYI